MREEPPIKNVREVKEVFDKLGIKYWLDCGTLLGAVRDGKIIEWDRDIDFGGMMDDNQEKIISALPELSKRGFIIRTEPFWFTNLIGKNFVFRRFGWPVGITLYGVNGENALRSVNWPTNLISGLLKLFGYLLFSGKLYTERKNFVVKTLEHCVPLFPLRLKKLLFNMVRLAWVRSGGRFGLWVVPKRHFENLETIKFYGMTFNIPSDVESYLRYRYGEDWKTPKKEWKHYIDDFTVRQ